MTQPRFPRALAVLFFVMLAAGLPGIYDRVVNDHAHTAGSHFVPWGLWVAAYIFFSGISAGAFPIATLPFVFGYRRFRPLVGLSLLVSLASLVAAMVFVTADLGRPERMIHLLMSPNPSSVMIYVIGSYTLYAGLLLVMLWLVLRPAWAKRAEETGSLVCKVLAFRHRCTAAQERADEWKLRVLSIVGLALVLCVGGGVGSLFAVLGGREFWHTGLFPVTFVVSALLSGAALVLATASFLGRGGSAFKETLLVLARLVGILLAVELVILPSEALIVLKGGIPSHLAVLRAIAGGPFAWVFWIMQIGIGTVAALLLFVVPRRKTLAVASVAALFVLIGVFAFRLNFVIPQLAHPETSVVVQMPSTTNVYYVPNLMEWNVVVFGVGLAGLAFVALYRLLPVVTREAPLEFELAVREEESAAVDEVLQASA